MPKASFFLSYDRVSGRLELADNDLRPARRVLTHHGVELHLLGHPIADGKRDDQKVLDAFGRTRDVDAFARALDGNFLILVRDPESRTLSVLTDRFSAYAFYWARQGERLIGSLSLVDLVRRLGSPHIDPVAIAEFLHFRRIFGEKTYDTRCSYLTSAGVLAADAREVTVRKYWQPDYSRERLGIRAGADAIFEALRGTMRMHMEAGADNRRYGLFMSGGLDSRALLAAAERKPVCITTCTAFNNEAAVAQECARVAGAPFSFVERPHAAYDSHIAEAVWYGGGQHVVTEAHFIGFASLLGSQADCFFLGLGLDIFLGGLYLPKSNAEWFGRKALHYRLDALGPDPAKDFFDGVKYRLRTADPWSVVAPAGRHELQNSVRAEIAEIAERGRALGAQRYDLWEYLHLHNLSRHYSFLMIQSVRHWAECRAPGLCNDLFDIAARLPAALKMNSSAYLAALRRLSPALMKVRNANTNVAAGMPLIWQSAVRAGRKGLNAAGARLRVSPGQADRSWPSPAEIITTSPELQSRIRMLPRSEHLGDAKIFDLGAVRRHVDDHIAGRTDSAMLLLVLVTIEEFLRQVHSSAA